ncbi:MAG: DUF3828 domain-containing protein [Patescibacteria group bacterium]|nr:DUF3828 domain-containing protein [Patescibacteria group bacterium]
MGSKEHGFSLIPIIIIALVLVGGVAFAVNYIVSTEKVAEIPKEETTVTEEEEAAAAEEAGAEREEEVKNPREVVEEFYTWYISNEGRPLSSGAYKESPYLAPSFKEYLDGGYGRGADLILCAQDIPPSFEVEDVSISGNTARVNLRQAFGPSGRIVPVELEKVEGEWLISDVLCADVEDVE